MADQEKAPLVGIIMGSKSDLPTMEGCTKELEELGVPYELVIASAHRNPDKVHEWAGTAHERGSRSSSLLRARPRTWVAWLPPSRRFP